MEVRWWEVRPLGWQGPPKSLLGLFGVWLGSCMMGATGDPHCPISMTLGHRYCLAWPMHDGSHGGPPTVPSQ